MQNFRQKLIQLTALLIKHAKKKIHRSFKTVTFIAQNKGYKTEYKDTFISINILTGVLFCVLTNLTIQYYNYIVQCEFKIFYINDKFMVVAILLYKIYGNNNIYIANYKLSHHYYLSLFCPFSKCVCTCTLSSSSVSKDISQTSHKNITLSDSFFIIKQLEHGGLDGKILPSLDLEAFGILQYYNRLIRSRITDIIMYIHIMYIFFDTENKLMFSHYYDFLNAFENLLYDEIYDHIPDNDVVFLPYELTCVHCMTVDFYKFLDIHCI
ncbi:hypothetical protein AGLY_003969 [Aphis glycines]|uniref:Uncharacterized protein n=1 Tax=Aphis glycines TaxID=307491 RepID=A0A6G0TX84_APHGL|nr:hypothetical protein AGLY_003969 [Aphis glycines]